MHGVCKKDDRSYLKLGEYRESCCKRNDKIPKKLEVSDAEKDIKKLVDDLVRSYSNSR